VQRHRRPVLVVRIEAKRILELRDTVLQLLHFVKEGEHEFGIEEVGSSRSRAIDGPVAYRSDTVMEDVCGL
jgi:hypothetical protein